LQRSKHSRGSSCGLNNEALEPLVGGRFVVLNASAAFQICSEHAREYFEAFFAAEKTVPRRPPLTVEKWVWREIDVFGTVELAVRRHKP
jgi:hypothetical protein